MSKTWQVHKELIFLRQIKTKIVGTFSRECGAFRKTKKKSAFPEKITMEVGYWSLVTVTSEDDPAQFLCF